MTGQKTNIISEILEKTSLSCDEFADILGISKNYLYRLEIGARKPSLELLEKLAALSGVSTGTLVDAFHDSTGLEAAKFFSGIRRHIDTLSKLRRERSERLEIEQRKIEIEQRNADLEYTVEHMEALLQLHLLIGRIWKKEHISRDAKKKEIETLAKLAVSSDEFSFDELLIAFDVKRPVLKSWMEAEKKVFKCKHIPDIEVMATSPSEAALRLRCFDCENFESKKCEGYGDMTSPDNIISLIAKLEAKGITKRDEQADLLKESYGMSNISAHQISEILYRNKTGKKIPEGAYFLEASEEK